MKLFFAADHDVELWPHFLAHYEELGFTEFFCCSTNSGLTASPTLQVIDHVHDQKLTYFSSLQKRFREIVFDNASTNWYGIAELDEFHFYPRSLQAILEECDQQGYDALFGTLIDRVAQDGKLPALRSDVPLEVQFPRTSEITARVLTGCQTKVMMCKGAKLVSGGNHGLKSPHRPHPATFGVNHFKWNENVLKRMRERVALGNDESNGWIAGNKRVLRHWDKYGSVLI